MYPTNSDPIQDAITHLQQIENDAGEKADTLDNFIMEVTDVKDKLEDQVNSLTELVSQLEDVANIMNEVEDAMSDADKYID